MTIPAFSDSRFIMEQQPRYTDLVIRKLRPEEHPLTLDMRIGNSTKETVDAVMRQWKQACADVGPFIYDPPDDEQQRLIHEFWDSFDVSCIYPETEFRTIDSKTEMSATFRYNAETAKQIEEQKKLEESKKIDEDLS